jgi:hypothetical protein
MDALHARGRFGALATTLTLALVLTACSAGAASAPPSDPRSAPPSTAPVVTDPPPSDGGDGGNIAPDGAKVVVPQPGQLDVHPVAAETLVATLDGRRLTVAVTWWSGVEPCTILDTVVVDAEDGGFAITLNEGRGPEDVACIAIAEQHRTFIDFPNDLAPGTYTIRDAQGGAPAIEVVVP